MSNKKRVLASQDILRYGRSEDPFDHMPSLEEWLLYFLEHFVRLSAKPNTYASFRSYICSHICPLLGDYPLNDITESILQAYVNIKYERGRLDGRGGLGVKTLKEHIMVLKLSFKRAIQLGIVSYDPCRCVEYPREVKKEVRVLNVQEQKRLTTAITPVYKENSMVPVLVAIHAGLRIGEVSALRIEDICLSKRQIQVDESLNRVMTYKEDGTVCCPLIYQSTKSSRVRNVPMHEALYKALKTYLDTMPRERREDPKAPLFHTRNGNVMEPRRISYHMHRLLRKLEIHDIHFHSLRHTFATRALEAGIPIKYCSTMLGHASTGITENLYAHASEEQLRKEIKKLDISYIPVSAACRIVQ